MLIILILQSQSNLMASFNEAIYFYPTGNIAKCSIENSLSTLLAVKELKGK